MSLSKPALHGLCLGSDQNAFTVQLLPFPHVDGQLLEKVQALAYFEEFIRQHLSQLKASATNKLTLLTSLVAHPP